MNRTSSQIFLSRAAPLLGLICLACISAANAGNLYKWIDENGQVRYSDTMPQSAIKNDRQTLNDQGMVIDSKEGAKTAEEYSARRKAEKERQKKLKEERLEVEANYKKDQALLLTFSSEEELELAKDERIEVLDSIIQLIYNSMAESQERLIHLESLALDNYISRDLDVPGGLAQKIEILQRKSLSREKQLRQKLVEKNKIEVNYEKDLARYRELTQSN